jgi:hypothetical protein
MADAERHLTIAAAAGTMGRSSSRRPSSPCTHRRAFSGNTDWGSVVLLYDALVCLSPTVGALVARAAALGQAIDAVASLGALDELPERIVVDYQPFWAVRADALARLGRCEEAGNAYARAIELSTTPTCVTSCKRRVRNVEDPANGDRRDPRVPPGSDQKTSERPRIPASARTTRRGEERSFREGAGDELDGRAACRSAPARTAP